MAATKQRRKTFWSILFVAYLILLFYFLFFSEMLGRKDVEVDYRYNLTLFREIKRFITYREILGTKAVFLNLCGNVLAFMPFGFCWPLLRDYRTNWFATTLHAFSVSLLAEVLQLVFKLGSFDVDDILLNTIGGLLGYICCMLFKKTQASCGKRNKSAK